MTQPTVLILSDDPDFPQALVDRWQTERSVPVFVLLTSGVWADSKSAVLDLAIVGVVNDSARQVVLGGLDALNVPTIFVAADAAEVQAVRSRHSRALTLPAREGWLDAAMLLSNEVLKRQEALARARRAEQSAELFRTHASMGRYMIEMRHSFNNALTSVLGNSELLLLEPGALSAATREQVETIHSMAMRMNEIMQRFSSMEAEMRVAQRPVHGDTTVATPMFSAAS